MQFSPEKKEEIAKQLAAMATGSDSLLAQVKDTKRAQDAVIEEYGRKKAEERRAAQEKFDNAYATLKGVRDALMKEKQGLYDTYRAPLEEAVKKQGRLQPYLLQVVTWIDDCDALVGSIPPERYTGESDTDNVIEFTQALEAHNQKAAALTTEFDEEEAFDGLTVYQHLHGKEESESAGIEVFINDAVTSWADEHGAGGVLDTKCENIRKYGLAEQGSGWRRIEGKIYDWDKMKGNLTNFRVVGLLEDDGFHVEAVYEHAPNRGKKFLVGNRVDGY